MKATQDTDVARYPVLDVLVAKHTKRGGRGLPPLEIFDQVMAHLAQAASVGMQRRRPPARKPLPVVARERPPRRLDGR